MFKTHKEQISFEKWAFGATPCIYDINLMLSWNSRHGDLFLLNEEGLMWEDLQKMYKFYKDRNAANDKPLVPTSDEKPKTRRAKRLSD